MASVQRHGLIQRLSQIGVSFRICREQLYGLGLFGLFDVENRTEDSAHLLSHFLSYSRSFIYLAHSISVDSSRIARSIGIYPILAYYLEAYNLLLNSKNYLHDARNHTSQPLQMSAYKMPDSAYKRLSFRSPDYGLLYNLHKRIFPMILTILIIITVCVVLAYSLGSRAVPRQFVVGMCITFSFLAVLWAVVSAIRCCRPKCAGKHNLRLESPAAEPTPAPELATTGWDGIGPGDFYDQPKQAPAVTRRGRQSTGLGDLSDRFKKLLKDWLDERYPFWHYRDGVRARAPAHASRERDQPGGRYALHNQYYRRREGTSESEGMLVQLRRSYLDFSDSGMTNAEAEDLYRRQRDKDYRAARGDAQRAHQAWCETDDNRSQNSDNVEVEPPRAVLREKVHYYNVSPREMDRVLDDKTFYVKVPARAHSPRR